MAKVKIQLNSKGVRQMLRSNEMMAICREHADAAAQRCGDGFSVNTHRGKKRVNAEVYAETFRAKRKNQKDNVILKALRGS